MRFKSTQLLTYLFENLEHGEGYTEAGELVSQTHPDIMNFVKELGIDHIPPGQPWSDEQNEKVKELGKAIDSITATTTIEPTTIKDLQNLANKSGEENLPNALAKIGMDKTKSTEQKGQEYADLMKKRDAGEGRNRGYGVESLVQKVVSGNYASPVLIKSQSGLVVIGGRTRLYAGLATGTPIKVKILDVDTLKQHMKTEPQQPSVKANGVENIHESYFDVDRWKKMAGILKG